MTSGKLLLKSASIALAVSMFRSLENPTNGRFTKGLGFGAHAAAGRARNIRRRMT